MSYDAVRKNLPLWMSDLNPCRTTSYDVLLQDINANRPLIKQRGGNPNEKNTLHSIF
jgi:hypothetical protein